MPLLSAAVAGGLALLSLVQLLRAILTILFPMEAMYREAIIYDQAARLLPGEALYQPLGGPPYTVAAHTSVYAIISRPASGCSFARF